MNNLFIYINDTKSWHYHCSIHNKQPVSFFPRRPMNAALYDAVCNLEKYVSNKYLKEPIYFIRIEKAEDLVLDITKYDRYNYEQLILLGMWPDWISELNILDILDI